MWLAVCYLSTKKLILWEGCRVPMGTPAFSVRREAAGWHHRVSRSLAVKKAGTGASVKAKSMEHSTAGRLLQPRAGEAGEEPVTQRT